MIVIGGGPIGMEMAQAHRRLGCEVTVIEGAKALGRDDPEMAAIVLENLRHEGIAIVEGAAVTAVGGEAGAIKVDRWSRTTAENIWAIGDVTDRMNLTPVAIREAVAFHQTVFRDNPQHFDYEAVATAVFSQPPVGVVGLSEAEARRSCSAGVDVYVTRFRPMKYAFTGSEERVLMKLVVDADSQRVVGVHEGA